MQQTTHKIDPQKLLTPAAKQIMQALESQGAKPRVVGGRVRDLILGHPTGDIDIAVDVPPEETKSLLRKEKIQVRDFGIVHGTVIAVAHNGQGIEVTSLREDIKTDGRHAEVKFGQDWQKDAERRDFTINAIYADLHGEILDPLGGLQDLQDLKIRFIGDPDQRIQEDYLRILRFFRFVAKYGIKELDPDALAACERHRSRIEDLPKERVTHEVRGIFGAKTPEHAIRGMKESFVLQRLLGKAKVSNLFQHFLLIEREYYIPPDWIARWMRIDTEPEYALNKVFCLTRKEFSRFQIYRQHRRNSEYPMRLGLKYGWDLAANCFLLEGNIHGGHMVPERLIQIHRASTLNLPVTAKDFLDLGVPKGPEIGKALQYAEDFWIEEDLFATREVILEKILPEIGLPAEDTTPLAALDPQEENKGHLRKSIA